MLFGARVSLGRSLVRLSAYWLKFALATERLHRASNYFALQARAAKSRNKCNR